MFDRFAKYPLKRLQAWLPYAVLLLASLWFCTPLVAVWSREGVHFHNYLFDSHEKLHYAVRLSEFHDALTHGQWVVRWCPNLEGGFGYPFFNFYAPLSYYMAELWHMAGLDLFSAWKLHFLLLTFLAGVGVYLYARLFYGALAATLAGLLYVLAPYHLVNLYVRGNVAEFAAMTLFPFVLLAFHALARHPARRGAFVGAAVSLGALVLAHNITALFGTAFLCAYLLCLWASYGRDFPAKRVALAGLAGILMSSFFWLPAIRDMKLVQSSGLSQTFQETPTHLVYWWQFFSNRWGFGLSLPGPADSMPFTIGWVHWVCVAGAVVAAFVRRDRVAAGLVAALFALLFFMSTWTGQLWTLPGLSTIQFPWRLLLIASFCSAAAGAAALNALGHYSHKSAWAAMALVCLGLIVNTAPKIAVPGYFLNSPELYQPQNTRRQFVSTNIQEFDPIWVRQHPAPDATEGVSHRRILRSSGDIVVNISEDEVTDARFECDLPLAQTLRYEVYYFPGWQVYCDGQPIETRPNSPQGLIEFSAPAGRHLYRIHYGHSSSAWAGMGLSWTGLLILAASVLFNKRQPAKLSEESSERAETA